VGVLVAILAAAIRWQFREFLEIRPFLPFFPAVVAAALYGGLVGGLTATVSSAALASYLWMEPHHQFSINVFADLIRMVLFLACSILISYLTEATYRAQARANKAEGQASLAAEREKVTELRRRQTEMFHLSYDAIIVWQLEGRIESWNKGAEELYGYSEKEALGQITNNLLKTIHPKPWPQIEAKLHKLKFWEGELKHRTREGREVIVSARLQLVRSSDGVERVLEISRDITERKKAEDEPNQAKLLLQNTLNAIQDLVTVHDRNLRVVLSNWQGRDHITQEERKSLPHCYACYMRRDKPCEPCPTMEVFRTGGAVRMDITNPFTHRITEVSAYPVINPSGDFDLVAEHVRDVTERKKAEEALQDSEEQFKAMFETVSIGMAQSDPKTRRWLRVNRKMCEITGYSLDEMLSKRVIEITHPEDLERESETFQNVITGRSNDYRLEKRYIRKDGTTVSVNVNMTLIRDLNGQPVRAMAAIEDISDRKRAEEEKARLQDQLLQSQKLESVGRLAGGVAHDFNNMLGVILGHTEMAMERVDSTQSLHWDLEEIHKAARRSADLTRQLLAFARKQTVSPQVLDPNETISSMLKMLQRLIGEDIELIWRPGHQLWDVKIDPSQLDQVLANLAVNARDAISGVGRVTIETANVVLDDATLTELHDCAPGEYISITFSDNGIGMSNAILDHIFEPFFTTKEVGKGTGLGLATLYGIVKQNQGCVEVFSQPGQGTTFKMYLPRFKQEADTQKRELSADVLHLGTETVLLVEDEAAIRSLGEKMLQRLGYTVLTADAPGKAIRLAEEHAGDIQLLITDVIMPEMNGKELAERLTSIKPGVKCLFMSGYSADAIARHGVLDKGIHFIQKPFSMKEMAQKVRDIWER
jgi:PAS domain S-box-containing protein